MNSEFVFCPRCGAVTKPGVCTNCGFKFETEIKTEEISSNIQAPQEEIEASPYVKQKNGEKKSKGWVIPLIIGLSAVVLLFVVLIIVAAIAFIPISTKIIQAQNNVNTPPSTVNPNPVQPDPLLPSIDDDEDKDNNPDDDVVPDDDIYDEFANYSETIAPLYGGTSEFDYDEFEKELIDKANEYWDLPAEETYDYYLAGNYSYYLFSSYSHDFKERDSYEAPYYEYVVDSYIENDNYDVERRIIRYEGNVDGSYLNAYCAYYALYSDDVDFTKVNEALRNQAISELDKCVKDKITKKAYNINLYSDAVITYNNDEVLSVVYNTTVYAENETEVFYLHGINVDMVNGRVMDNTKILNFDDSFSKFFVQRSNTQNSFLDSINYSDIKDVTKVLNDDDSLLIFFTPLGIEVGCNYRYHYSYGWVTVTINNFDNYLSGEYDFNADFGKSYDIYKYEQENGITPKDPYFDDYDDYDL